MCVWSTFISILFTIFISNMKLTRVFDVNIMLHPVKVKHLNFPTKPLSLVATFLYFSKKLRFYGLSCSCSRNSSYLHSGRPSRRATVQFSSRGMWRRSCSTDFAIKRRFFRRIYRLLMPAFETMYIRIFHSFANRKRPVFISLFLHKVSQTLS